MSRPDPLPLGPLSELESRIRRDFQDLSRSWAAVREVWKDSKAVEFEREKLEPLAAPTNRLLTQLKEFSEQVRECEKRLRDESQIED